MQPLTRRPPIIGPLGQQTPGAAMIGGQPLDQRRQMRRQPPRNPAHPIMFLHPNPHIAGTLAIGIGIRVIDAQHRPQHRRQRIQIIDLDMLHQLRDVRISHPRQLRMHRLRETTQHPVDLLHRIGTNHPGLHLRPDPRHVRLIARTTHHPGRRRRVARRQTAQAGLTTAGLGTADALGTGDDRRHLRLGNRRIITPGLQVFGVDDRQHLPGLLQLPVSGLALIAGQPMPGAAGHGGGLGDRIDGYQEIGGASGWCAHGPKAKPEHPRTPVLTMNSSGPHTRWPMKGLGPTGCGE